MYKEIKDLCKRMDTHSRTHNYAREPYETVSQTGDFVSEPLKAIISCCLFIAYEATNMDCIYQERNISYHECNRKILLFKAAKILVWNGHEAMVNLILASFEDAIAR